MSCQANIYLVLDSWPSVLKCTDVATQHVKEPRYKTETKWLAKPPETSTPLPCLDYQVWAVDLKDTQSALLWVWYNWAVPLLPDVNKRYPLF